MGEKKADATLKKMKEQIDFIIVTSCICNLYFCIMSSLPLI